MEDKKALSEHNHNIVLESRRRLTASSVKEVESFDENNIIAITSLGELVITGTGLHINSFSTDNGDLIVEGEITSLSYSDTVTASGGFFSRIFR
ncbi:MAG: sporulation protein YabP [Clostridia bacterium]|nr:sporulation protein YabP [Clostridia bacterium]